MTLKHLVLILLAVLVGCATGRNYPPFALKSKPLANTYVDPSFDASTYKTFSVVPISVLREDSKLKEGILERQIMFSVRVPLEVKGYTYVPLESSPDFLVAIDVHSPYRERYVPPKSVTVPKWVPGTQMSTNTYGTLSSRYGAYSAAMTSTTNIPGYVTTETVTRPGYITGAYYPSVEVQVFDAKSLRAVWTGSGVGVSDNQDVRVSHQYVLAELLRPFPECATYVRSPGAIGLLIALKTTDGNNYNLFVFRIKPRSPAARADIRPGDMITSINGTPTLNKTQAEISELMRGEASTRVSLNVSRNGKEHSVEMLRVDASILNSSGQR